MRGRVRFRLEVHPFAVITLDLKGYGGPRCRCLTRPWWSLSLSFGVRAVDQVVGALGLLASALQSMPIGRLDGGRATTSVFGRKAATFLSASLVLYQVRDQGWGWAGVPELERGLGLGLESKS